MQIIKLITMISTIDVNNVIYVIYCGGKYALFNIIYLLTLFIYNDK